MQVLKLLPLFGCIFFATLSGCASSPKTEYFYFQAFNSGVNYQKAISQCQYEEHLQSRADMRADVDSGRGLISILTGKPSATQIYCMKRFGWELQSRVAQQSQQISNSNTQFTNQPEKSSADISNESLQMKKLYEEFRQRANVICANPEFEVFFKMSPCQIKSLSESNLIDSTFMSESVGVIARRIWKESELIDRDRTKAIQQFGSATDKAFEDIHTNFTSRFESNRFKLLTNSINFGQFNSMRKELNEKMWHEMDKVEIPISNLR